MNEEQAAIALISYLRTFNDFKLQMAADKLEALAGALEDIRDFTPNEEVASPPHTQIAVFAKTRARAALAQTQFGRMRQDARAIKDTDHG